MTCCILSLKYHFTQKLSRWGIVLKCEKNWSKKSSNYTKVSRSPEIRNQVENTFFTTPVCSQSVVYVLRQVLICFSCSEALEMFCSLRNLIRLSISMRMRRQWPHFHFWVNLSYNHWKKINILSHAKLIISSLDCIRSHRCYCIVSSPVGDMPQFVLKLWPPHLIFDKFTYIIYWYFLGNCYVIAMWFHESFSYIYFFREPALAKPGTSTVLLLLICARSYITQNIQVNTTTGWYSPSSFSHDSSSSIQLCVFIQRKHIQLH